MFRYLMISMLVFLTACGTAQEPNPPKAEPSNGQVQEKPDSGGNGIVAGKVEINAVSINTNKAVFEVKNQTEQIVELQLSSGQQFDLWITDESGNEVFHWAEGKVFTQALMTKTLKQGESLTYEVEYPELKPGTNKFKFVFTSKPPIEQIFEHTIQ
ncbi:BsuPI-related putative proteinase inhibitor [Alkalihalobacillus sp. AL-G]|uniref:BsuPI-related putative proteinase inhibitor n=1 Tax=Alkalihalobacillus sp. AL-G TaxID=2926399 RepID=UPI00272B5265|nr:BsuPI-related putative proteinase inhibitor [Alkalihalobacillus sp. AL-G]WLD94178.1 BsuPI-related putative proteinase inhibitor [Alkalihalobacillus sp. AL-G]